MLELSAKWISTAASVLGTMPVAVYLDLVVYGFELFLVSSLFWSAIGQLQREMSMVALHGTFTVTNIVDINRWRNP